MCEAQRISALIGHIYDAALGPALWTGVLEQVAKFVGGSAASLVSKDAANKTGEFAFQAGLDEQYVRLYFEKYIRLDPNTTGQVLAEVAKPVSVADFMPYQEFLQTRFYCEWSRPQGLVDAVSAVLERSETSAALLVVFRHQRDGLVDDAARRRMRLVVPHIRRAALIGKVIEMKTAEAATFADSLDGISAGMLLIDATGRIVHANAAGHSMLAHADVLGAVGGRLIVTDAQADQALADIFASAGNGDAALGIKGVALPLTARGGERYVAHVLPLTSGARRRSSTTYRAVAALFVHKAALESPSPPEAIAKAFGLTRMELRVLFAVVEVGGVPEVAEALGIAETTVKTHLGHLYGKTGASRQADLVKLVAGFSSPLMR
jgi:DNA-binding CsgD family transcriptional regulator